MNTAVGLSSAVPVAGPVVGAPLVSRLAPLRHHRYTVDEYEELVRQGHIWASDRCELIRGVVTDKMGIGDLHAACVMRLNRFFSAAAATHFLVSIQSPIILSDSVPEPDCALVAFRNDFYVKGKPRNSDVLLVVEVADSSLNFDRDVKGPMYAEAGIADFWIINLIDDCVEIYRQPRADGTYAEPRIARRGELLSVLALPGLNVAVTEILGAESRTP
jgi:Uma2 family endonuclease